MLLTLTILAALGAADIKVNVSQPALKVAVAQPAVKTSTLMKGLIFWAPLTTNWTRSTTVASDRSSTHDTCTLTGTPPTFSSTGVDFNGTSDYVACGDQSVFSFGNGLTDSPFSVSAWVYADTIGAGEGWLAKGKYATDGEWYFSTGCSGDASKVCLCLIDNSVANGYQCRTTSAGSFAAGAWVHVVATYSGVGGVGAHDGINIYKNGSDADTADYNGAGAYVAMENLARALTIAYQPHGVGYWWDGKIRDARIWNRALTQAEITELYVGGPTP